MRTVSPLNPGLGPKRLTRRAFLDRTLRASAGIGGGLLAASLLDACTTSSGSATPSPPAGAKVIRALLLDQVGYEPGLLQKIATRFQELNHGKVFVSIETAHYRELYESILASGLSKPSAYDVVAVDQVWVPELASRHLLLKLNEQVPDDVRADLMPNLLDAFSYSGVPWALPHVLNVQSLYYNKAHLESVGFREPPSTLERWYEQMTALRRSQTPYVDSWAEGEGLVSDFVRLSAQFGGDLFDAAGQPQIESRPVLQAATFMRRLIDERLVRAEVGATTEPDAMRAFLSGGVSFNTNWNFVFGAMNDPSFSRIIGQGRVAPLPAATATGKPAASVSGFLGLAVLSGSRQQEPGVAWIRYLTSPEVQAQQLGQLPIWTSLQRSPDFLKANPQMEVFLTNLANATPRPKLTHYVEASSVLQRHLHSLVIGSATPEAATAAAQAELVSLQARWAR